MADDDSRWIRKATDLERMFEIGHQHGVYLTHYTLDLATVKPIDEDFMRRCLQHLYRQVPVLRVCLQERKNSELWLREMKECNIDLKIIQGGILEDEREKVTLHTYDSKVGPLWCVRFITETKVSEEDKDFPYAYKLIFGMHHSLADGGTIVKICNLLCNLISKLMSGQVVDDEHQLGEITDEEEILSLYDKEYKKLKTNFQLSEEVKTELTEGSKVRPFIRHICTIPPDTPILSRDVSIVFDKIASEKFHKKTKSMGVSLHSALTGVINLALVKLLQEHGITEDEYNFRAGHTIDIRRYFSRDSTRDLGVIGPLFVYRAQFWTPKDMLPVFWEVVRKFHEKLHSDIASRRALTTSAFRIMHENANQNLDEVYKADTEPSYYYTISNMGNLAGKLPEEDQFVSVRRLIRFCSLRSKTFMIIFIHTFKKQLNMNFAYSTKFLSHDFICHLRDLCQMYMTTISET